MAVTAYASLASLTHLLDNVQDRVRLGRLPLDVKQIQHLQENLDTLIDFVELHSQVRTEEIQHLWTQIAEVADEVENIFNLYVVTHLRKTVYSEDETHHLDCSNFYQDLDRLIQRIVFFIAELSMFQDQGVDFLSGKKTISYAPSSSSTLASSCNNIVVGFDGHLGSITDVLTRDRKSSLRVFPIVGMGGIGKTTLAKSVFEHRNIVEHFDMRIWLTISQDYSVKEILLGLLNEGRVEGSHQVVGELGVNLRKKLYGRRYLIVMDDVWSSEAWYDFKRFFPNNSTGSWIIMTTRLSNLVISLGFTSPYQMNFLDDNISWNLLCRNSFSQEVCPFSELEEVGKKIAKRCRGLPIAIVTIGRLLAKSNMTREYWELVAEKMRSFGDLEDGEYCLNILSVSYNSLPLHLKPCFLSMSVFAEDEYVKPSELIRLWVSQGFIRLVSNRSLKEIAKDFLKDLVDRSLMIMIITDRPEGGRKIKKCGIHDLLRDICIRECRKEHFHLYPSKKVLLREEQVVVICCLCGRAIKKEEVNLLESVVIPMSSSQACLTACRACEAVSSTTKRWLTFVRAIDIIPHGLGVIRLVQSIQLRSVSIDFSGDLEFMSPSPLHLLWNLQTLIVCVFARTRQVALPPEILEMPQLREIKITPYALFDLPDCHFEQKDFCILRKLVTLSCIKDFKCRNEIVERIPNVRKLDILYTQNNREWGLECPDYSLCNLVQFQKLESLKVFYAVDQMAFPNSLRKLVLCRCRRIPWKDMTVIGSLPNLEGLVLVDTTEGPEWSPIEGEFQRLKRLEIFWEHLVSWRADWVHFPALEQLVLRYLHSLKEIPSGIGDIPSLQSIHLSSCSDSVIYSAKLILEEQRDMGNEALQIHAATTTSGVWYKLDGSKPSGDDEVESEC